jgi:hypothetical protein
MGSVGCGTNLENEMNPIRKAAQDRYEAALRAVRIAEQGTDEQAYADADAALTIARRASCEADAEYPTPQEQKRAANLLRLRNRGLDI